MRKYAVSYDAQNNESRIIIQDDDDYNHSLFYVASSFPVFDDNDAALEIVSALNTVELQKQNR